MPRIRTIKPEFWTDSFMVQCSYFDRLLYIALWSMADDEGYITGEVDRVQMEVMPRDTVENVASSINLFEAAGRLEKFVSGTEIYYRIAKWNEHQRVDRPTKSKIAREPSRKLAIPQAARRAVATKYGCQPGTYQEAECYYCGLQSGITWHRLSNGNPSYWVTFGELELDHFVPEARDGENSAENLVLACRFCNRSFKDAGVLEKLLMAVERFGGNVSCTSREPSRALANIVAGSGNRDQGKEQGNGTGNMDLVIGNELPTPRKNNQSSVQRNPPSVDEVRRYMADQGYADDADAFVDFYTSNGWVQGRGKPIKDWQAAVRNWQRNKFSRDVGSAPKTFAQLRLQNTTNAIEDFVKDGSF